MIEKASCPFCGERLPGGFADGRRCPGCGRIVGMRESAGDDTSADTAPLPPADGVPARQASGAPTGTPASGRARSASGSSTSGASGRASNFPAGCTPRGTPSRTPSSGPERTYPSGEGEPGLADGVGDGTVGGYKTVQPTSSDTPVHWQEGLLVAERFRIIRFIGQGGMGKVFLAQDETLARPIALKRVPQEIIFDADARDDLRQEANRLLDLAHEHIVRVHTFYEGPTWPFFAMEHLQGPTLKKLLRTRKQYGRTFTPEEVLCVAHQVAQGLSYAHAKGIIHRDLKPGNLMLAVPPAQEITESDVVKITDFGVSRVIAESTMRHSGKRSGTLPYMSPEQFHGEPCTVQSDIYSFACTLYELLSGSPPFHSGDLGYQIVHVPPKPLTGVPKAMADAIHRGLCKDPRRRFQSVEEFEDALEGKIRARSPFVLGRFVSLGVKAAVLFAFIAFLWVLLQQLVFRQPENPRVTGGGTPTRRAPLEPTREQEKADFVARLRAELQKQIPPLIGRADAPDRSSTSGTITLVFSFSRPQSLTNYQIALYDGLLLQYYSKAPGNAPSVPGVERDGKKVFTLESLPEGSYTLKAYTEQVMPDGPSVEKLLDDDPVKFTIDLTPPEFELQPLDESVLVSTEPPASGRESDPVLLTTFDEFLDIQVRPFGDPGDIAEAYAQVVFSGAGTAKYEKMENAEYGRAFLAPGVDTLYRVYAVDAAGNESEPRELKLHRLDLNVDRFELATPDGVVGNKAQVRGVLQVEGDYQPRLMYFADDALLEADPAQVETEGASSPASAPPGLTGIPFAATLLLPKAVNTIEVRYSWNDNPPRSFARAAKIPDVKVRAPRISLLDMPTYTNKVHIEFKGRVEPVFEGLEVYLDHVGHGNSKLILTRTSYTPSVATFSEDLDLAPDEENSFRLICFYRKEQLTPVASKFFSVFCDTTKPTLADKVQFEVSGNRLSLSVYPLDELSKLRVRENVGGQTTQWRAAEWDVSSFAYRYVTRLPQRKIVLEIELTDLAGNTALFSEPFNPVEFEESAVVSAAPGDVPPAPLPGESVARATFQTPRAVSRKPGVSWLVSPWLEELGMDFVPFGGQRYEMARIELPDRAWNVFLKERDNAVNGSTASVDYPMTLNEVTPDLLRAFVKWFGKKSNDGYVYEIPTADQWLMAFTGSSDSGKALEEIARWFRGEGKGKSEFHRSPRERYGSNKVLRIGSRPENQTPTGLLDMVANVQEIVMDGEVPKVIGGSNRDADVRELQDHCQRVRPYSLETREFQGSVTGVRLCRRPASTVE